ncbi:hypothetical protein BU17DRAFT_50124 [Hysterangium stoloniferum]|nr:hypothetical protein BU17DRAFT_50124 [Hysterangium stoloniferum]
MARRQTGKDKQAQQTAEEISEAEQWRLINQSGILDATEAKADPSPQEDTADEVFNAVLLIIPFSFLYLMMDILVHLQYGRHPTVGEYAGRLVSAVPLLSLIIFYVPRYRSKRRTQFGLFVASAVIGMRLIWVVNRSSWLLIMKQGPPLATLWIYGIVVLDLLPAVSSLAVVATWFWWYDMKLIF